MSYPCLFTYFIYNITDTSFYFYFFVACIHGSAYSYFFIYIQCLNGCDFIKKFYVFSYNCLCFCCCGSRDGLDIVFNNCFIEIVFQIIVIIIWFPIFTEISYFIYELLILISLFLSFNITFCLFLRIYESFFAVVKKEISCIYLMIKCLRRKIL